MITGNTVQVSPPFIVDVGDLERDRRETLGTALDDLAGAPGAPRAGGLRSTRSATLSVAFGRDPARRGRRVPRRARSGSRRLDSSRASPESARRRSGASVLRPCAQPRACSCSRVDPAAAEPSCRSRASRRLLAERRAGCARGPAGEASGTPSRLRCCARRPGRHRPESTPGWSPRRFCHWCGSWLPRQRRCCWPSTTRSGSTQPSSGVLAFAARRLGEGRPSGWSAPSARPLTGFGVLEAVGVIAPMRRLVLRGPCRWLPLGSILLRATRPPALARVGLLATVAGASPRQPVLSPSSWGRLALSEDGSAGYQGAGARCPCPTTSARSPPAAARAAAGDPRGAAAGRRAGGARHSCDRSCRTRPG